MRDARIALLAWTAPAFALFLSSVALANGRFPASNQIVFSPADPRLVVVRTTFGILLSHDGGATWAWLCEEALGISPSSPSDPVLAVTSGGASGGSSGGILFATRGLDNGVVVSTDMGCGWEQSPEPLASQIVKDLAVRPDAPDRVLAVTSTYGAHAGAEGGPGYAQQVYEMADAGWSPVGQPIDSGMLVTSFEVAAADPRRIYVSALRFGSPVPTASLFVTTDDGAHWVERAVPLDARNEAAAYIAAVDSTDANRVYLRTSGSPSRLLVTVDAGQTFAAALSLNGQMRGFALSADGSKVYAGSVEDGLFVAARADLAFKNVSSIHVQCLATHGADLWACADEPSGFIAGVSADDGATFAAKLRLAPQPPLACGADAAATQCLGVPLQQLCALLSGCDSALGAASPDAGAPGAAAPPDAGVERGPSRSACGCSTVGASGGWPGQWMAAGLAAAGSMRRRRRRLL
ncbi:MAG: MYXO-CTERM sorting domain-containing protein [Myxococcota bacterium]|nr:MYXO-CTERM sorting domain-containing protein [Myxococcota bacterium]